MDKGKEKVVRKQGSRKLGGARLQSFTPRSFAKQSKLASRRVELPRNTAQWIRNDSADGAIEKKVSRRKDELVLVLLLLPRQKTKVRCIEKDG